MRGGVCAWVPTTLVADKEQAPDARLRLLLLRAKSESIDHILVRGGRPLTGDVFDFGVWSIADEVPRIEANLRNTGSDHFPIGGAFGF